MIILDRRDIEAKDSLAFDFGMTGRFTLQAVKNGKVIREKEFSNLITNNGLDLYGARGTRTVWGRCFVGTGTAIPQFTDTGLANYLAMTTYSGATNTYNTTLPDVWAQTDVVYTFNVGAVVGNITEIGVGASANNLFSRALIVDGGGTPVAFPVLADEQLRVTYSFRVYIPSGDFTGTVTIGSTTYDYLCRGRSIANTNLIAATNFSGDSIMPQSVAAGSESDVGAFSGAAVAASVANNISGPLGTPTSINRLSYAPNSLYREWSQIYGPSTGNGNVRTVLSTTNTMTFQTQYTPAIPKSNTNTLTLPFRFSWARR